ncbi:benzoylformate decarboxylase [Diaporthe amygdali]|uniref:benzoylformate decarboxylase n=1 Tax=Phomopsis amygdali TaxID=1214568 RepID=UPI0022FE64CE|nr:benzoylformate decarboxylase [Diaporthe amygdali]KAJ0117554.1 benzoylformate decarboxylase [Diaporthe amygdali]
MLPTTIHASPSLADFTPLSEYQSTTPESFHGGKPVLHYHATGAKVWLPKDQQTTLPIFPADSPVSDGDSGEIISQDDVELAFTIFNHKSGSGVQIPFPSIALHAMQHKAEPVSTSNGSSESEPSKTPCILLQLDLSDGGADDETFDTVQLTIIPPNTSTDLSSAAEEGSSPRSEQEKLFDAITACQNLHPDPEEEDDEEDGEDYADRIIFESNVDGSGEAIEGLPGAFRGSASGGLPPPMPGSSGWITAENVNDFFDEDGNWIGGGAENGDEDGEELGDGAGRVRSRDHDGVDEGENKRLRTE